MLRCYTWYIQNIPCVFIGWQPEDRQTDRHCNVIMVLGICCVFVTTVDLLGVKVLSSGFNVVKMYWLCWINIIIVIILSVKRLLWTTLFTWRELSNLLCSGLHYVIITHYWSPGVTIIDLLQWPLLVSLSDHYWYPWVTIIDLLEWPY